MNDKIADLNIPPMPVKRRVVDRVDGTEFCNRLYNQKMHNSNDLAFVCPVCATVQSVSSLKKVGASVEIAARMIGYQCEGDLIGAGPWPNSSDQSDRAKQRRAIRGCNWTLGGHFKIHVLEVLASDVVSMPWFQVATPAQAEALKVLIEDRKPFGVLQIFRSLFK